ncbi:MAG: hypothetical protein N3F05_03825 [Candidatus Diapherotrites archaeon]|nr:hypothetical protein [Candidatus Diapherotrites archaeon]
MHNKEKIRTEVPLLNLELSKLFGNKKLFILIVTQLFLLAGTALMVYKILEPSFEHMSLKVSNDSRSYIALALFVCSLFVINKALKKKKSRLYMLQLEAGETLKRNFKQKVKAQKENPFGIALLLLEFILVIVLAGAIDAYLIIKDTHTEMLSYQEEFFLFVAKVLIFLAILFFVVWLHRYASSFDSIKFRGRSAIKILRDRKACP